MPAISDAICRSIISKLPFFYERLLRSFAEYAMPNPGLDHRLCLCD
jgi:hypothetical protein